MTARPSRGELIRIAPVEPVTASSIITAGPQPSTVPLPSISTSVTPNLGPSALPNLYNALATADGDDENPDTDGFVWDDNNIFETGGLNNSEPDYFKRKPLLPKRTKLTEAHVPTKDIFHNGELYEFLGYEGDVELSDEELNSFQGEPGEYSDFLPILGALKVGKKIFKNRKKIGGVLKTAYKHRKNIRGGLKQIFRKRKKTAQARFDGLVEYEYFIGPAEEYSDLFGIKLKKIGKALGKPLKAVGKGVKKAAKAVGKAGKFIGKNVARGVKAVGKVAMAVAGGGAQAQEEPTYSQGPGIAAPEINMPAGYNPDNGMYMSNESSDDGDLFRTPGYFPENSDGSYNEQDSYEAPGLFKDGFRTVRMSEGSGKTTLLQAYYKRPVVILAVIAIIGLIIYLKTRK